MKIELFESQYNSWFEIEPETATEVAMLFRMVNNSKAEKPEMYLSFGTDENQKVWCNVTIKKLKPTSSKISNSINNHL